jgi:2,3-diaminopropionate biosynthesis protein SbnB
MHSDDILILRGNEVSSLLSGQELDIIRAVRMAYEAHSGGDSSLPHSTFLRFPAEQRNRIIALPAYLGDEFKVAGIKWVSSFPANVEAGLDRASAVVILNSTVTGRPEAIIEGSIISAKRTAASAALAAQCLKRKTDSHVGFVGCGLINFEIARFLLAACPELDTLTVYDLKPDRSRYFAAKCEQTFPGISVNAVEDLRALFGNSSVVSMATTAIQPHVADLSDCAAGSTILHISLRDLMPEVVLSCDNIVDDVDHVCRAQTSVHLAEQTSGNRDFIRCTLADILKGIAPARLDPDAIAVFSPFGLGILDLAVAQLVCGLARQDGQGSIITSFLPSPWADSEISNRIAQA